jgi:hypothetical protein
MDLLNAEVPKNEIIVLLSQIKKINFIFNGTHPAYFKRRPIDPSLAEQGIPFRLVGNRLQ